MGARKSEHEIKLAFAAAECDKTGADLGHAMRTRKGSFPLRLSTAGHFGRALPNRVPFA